MLCQLLLAALLSAVSAQVYEQIQCPFPRSYDDVDVPTYCNTFSACLYNDATGKCYMRGPDEIGYVVTSDPVTTPTGFTVDMQLRTKEYSMFDADIENLRFEVINHEDYHLQIKIYDMDDARYEIPVPINLPSTPGDSPQYAVQVSSVGEPFSFSVSRLSTGTTIFQTVGALTFEDQFSQFTTVVASDYMYGFGESTHQEFKRPFEQTRDSYAILARDQPVSDQRGVNEYGFHPYYMSVEDDDGNTHSVLYYNSNAMEYATFLLDDGLPVLTLNTIGGIVDLHFFMGPTYEDATKQYLEMIGRPIFPPYYFLGYQLSRWGYEDTNHVRLVRERTKNYSIPQDIQVFDIDYMENYRDFTLDKVNFGDINELIDELHADGIRATIILDPAIVIDVDNYPPYQRGRDVDAYIPWMDESLIPDDQEPYADDYIVGYVWPNNKTVFPDFLKPETQQWWIDEVKMIKDPNNTHYVNFDVMWIDMNEPACFGTGTDKPWNWPENEPDWSLKCPYNKYDSPPFPTKTTYTGSQESFRISDHSICLSTTQTDGQDNYLHYDVKNLYGWSNLQPTKVAMDELFPGRRNPILIRSTFPGCGTSGVHWLGDNTSGWQWIKMSIWGMFEFNMFGMPYVGADICGFFAESWEELCLRWTLVGAFYPFNRNHNSDGSEDQDPAKYGDKLGNAAREIMLFRYKYNPYLYTLFYEAATTGATVVRPFLANYMTDIPSRTVDDQFMWGDGLMVAPIMDESLNGDMSTDRDVYFPPGNWYDMFTFVEQAGSTTISLNVAEDAIPVYVRGGTILPYQEPAINTDLSRLNPMGLLVALDESGASSGSLFWDDGESLLAAGTEYFANFAFANDELTVTVDRTSSVADGLNYETIDVLGYADPTSITANGIPLDSSQWTFNTTSSSLTVTLSSPIADDLSLVFSFV